MALTKLLLLIFLIILILFLIINVWVICNCFEGFICLIFHLPPMVPSSKKMRNAIINEINKNYRSMKTVIDIGSCYGGLARRIARECNEKLVIAVERMICPAIISKTSDFFCDIKMKKSKTILSNAFKFIKKSDGFDIGVAYLFPTVMKQLEELKHKFKVLIILDFSLPNSKPNKKIKLHEDRLGQHWMYIYE